MLDDKIITSAQNRRIIELRKLDQRKHRERQGRFLVEGLHILHMALATGRCPLEAYYCTELFAGTEAARLLEKMRAKGVAAWRVSSRVMRTISRREASQGIVATFATSALLLSRLDVSGKELVIVLDRLRDPGNLGTIVRTADAVGASGVVLIEPCADPFDPKTVRATMGSLFNVPIVRTSEAHHLFEHLHGRGLRSVAADAHLGTPWGHGLWRGGVALVLGNEARGLSADVRPLIRSWAHLPIVGGAESLNVATAAGVLMYTWLQQNWTSASRDSATVDS